LEPDIATMVGLSERSMSSASSLYNPTKPEVRYADPVAQES
jgi:hypothetical protein